MDSYSKSYWEKCDINVTAKPMRSGKVLEQSYGLYRFTDLAEGAVHMEE